MSRFYQVLLVLSVSLAYCYALALSYEIIVSPHFEYMGYVLIGRTSMETAICYLLALLPALWLPVRLKRPSHFVYGFLYCVVYVPFTMLGPVATDLPWGLFVVTALLMAVGLRIVETFSRLPLLVLPQPSLGQGGFWLCFGALTVALAGVVVAKLGMPSHLPSLYDVYNVRAEYKASTNPLVAYSVLWLGKVCGPFLIASGAVCKRYRLVAIGVCVQLAVFSMTGWKSVFFSVLIITASLVLAARFREKAGLGMVAGSLGVVAVSVIADSLFKQVIVSSLFLRRMIVTPGMLTGHYVKFFTDNPKVELTHSVFSGLGSPVYDTRPAITIGREVFGRTDMAANANVWADAFANFGFAGIIIFSVLLGLAMWVYDSVSARHGLNLGVAVLSLSAFSLSDTALLTVMLTHGLGLMVLLLYLYPTVRRRGRSPWGLRAVARLAVPSYSPPRR